ncbi:MAG TPA: glutathione synthase [Steroidobacteraceae bacterium]|nr:glutathione synthase [Steroidobacteraceae bacterium]
MPKALSLAVVMDPIAKIKFAKDSTLAMLLAASARGWKLTYFEQSDLFLRDGKALGHGRPLEVYDDSRKWFALGEPRVCELGGFDCVFMRKDPPFDAEYIYTTYILERAELQGAFVANKPQGLRDMNEKVFTAWFPQCCAPTLITRAATDIKAFAAEHGRIVVKPLDGMGGRSIFVTDANDKNLPVIIETLTDFGQRFAIAQRYLPEIAATGDSRILLIDGEPVPHALARIPLPTDNRGNLAAGAKGVGRELNERDRWLAAQIGPALAGRGMVFVGIDVIGGFVTEINVTSPTGIRELDQQFGLNIGAMVIEAFERRIGARNKPG